MTDPGTKISFAFGGAGNHHGASSSSGSAAAPMSNMAKLLAQAQAKSTPAGNLFGDDDDEDSGRQSGPSLAGPSKPQATRPGEKKPISRAERRAQEEALRVDATVFDYDGVYDGMKAAEREIERAKKEETAERKPKYTESFLAAAQTRKLDRLRAEEKMLQLEREKEGGQFDDKDKFVTEAYKKQMEEVRKAEEEERIREEEIRKSKKGTGLSAFYQTMLDDDSKRHAAAVAAAHGSTDSGPNLSIRPPTQPDYEPEVEYDPFLAQEARARQTGTEASGSSSQRNAGTTSTSEDTGKEVVINDDGEVVDKRSLLKAGLNIMKKPSANLPDSLLTSQRSGQTMDGPYKSRAVGTAASYQERMERERKRLAEELKRDAERKKEAEEEAQRAEEEAARKRREGNDGEAMKKREEARLRFLERKRAREQEQEEKSKKAKKDEEDDS
ncbi:coiled-coil domain-containing protein 55-domain containing protein [Kockovaella imperatae]|uniref:Coiled-coil domain-containing protein 55-domain containing protein n=1 Tax=Kockovaella imperatae TaxID=4999 RepID=A0A1Y1U6C1_9TREE|nr:coiled-coil domain-containing protein 55-domain containing protein [Kockovaella imperatae]ORX33583.1 coiled-coil domain-containing protein 55-domain containing protein [Kockovaella imperatae]